MQKILLGILAILAVVGWGAAYVYFTESRELTQKLASSEAEQAESVAALDTARDALKKQTDSAGRLEEIESQLSAAETKSDNMAKELQDRQRDFMKLSQETDSKKRELTQVERQLIETTNALNTSKQDADLANQELTQLRAQIADLSQRAEQAQNGPQVGAAPGSAETAAAPSSEVAKAGTTATDKRSRTDKLFDIVDSNGDGKIDEFEFRLESVKLLGVMDANDDGFVTPDETQLPPDRFRLFDQNGDGKIGSIEFVEAYQVLDRDGKGAISREDYQAFIESAAK